MKRKRKKINFHQTNWTTEQDCFLIENNQLSVVELTEVLHFSEDEIISRMQTLGLIRRSKMLKKYV
ncbi:hypothetical protein [Acinetobacter rudis]|uniref:Uncharacterized protein n=1 Tax=Acinetobacter rudis CIP 110305 TaxID=421052 RepID=S3N8A7_9GAMM|nr:hypothetical protein [Acinetobacter rudis]EPF74618.1 hypothetical protein F945_01385 [Acinetobacter rudis CIP 110305]